MKERTEEIGELTEEYDHYCSEHIKPITDEDGVDAIIFKATHNITVASEIAKQLVRAKFDQELQRRRNVNKSIS